MSEKRVALFLVEHSDFQELLRQDAEAAAAAAGLDLDVYFTGHDFAAQLKQIRETIDGQRPPNAILVLAVRDHGLARAVRSAVRAGISFVFLNRTDDDLFDIRREARSVANVSEICADEVETGRIQGRQFRALLPKGGRILYIQGSSRSLSARDRTQGMQEAVQGAPLEITLVEAGWSIEEAAVAVHTRLTLLGRVHAHVDLIGCHTDQIAVGAMKALEEVAAELKQPEIARIPVTGCDATPVLGQPLVTSGRMAASIVLPRTTRAAIETVVRSWAGVPLPSEVFVKAESFPPERELKPLPTPHR
jgi:ABC-type sugar transport system substrate-binding protein